MKVKDVKHKVTLDDFEHRLLVGCVNVARTMYLEQNKPTEDVDDLLVKIIKSTVKESERESMKDEIVKNIGVWGQVFGDSNPWHYASKKTDAIHGG